MPRLAGLVRAAWEVADPPQDRLTLALGNQATTAGSACRDGRLGRYLVHAPVLLPIYDVG
jgi:hypothetical protein